MPAAVTLRPRPATKLSIGRLRIRTGDGAIMAVTTSRRWWRKKRYALPLALLSVPLVLSILFAVNGLFLAANETPVSNLSPADLEVARAGVRQPVLKVVAYNIAKGFAYQEGISFADEGEVRARMDQIAEFLRAEQPDVVFLSEALFACGPCPVNQVERLAEEAGLPHWVFGENFNFGLPFYRIVGGNAILSRFPIEPVANPSLPGRRPFYITKNNRRVLWCRAHINGRPLLLAAIHNDSFDLENNDAQMKEILAYVGDRDALMAGDFNARADEPPIRRLLATGKFSGASDGPFTFSTARPHETIDFIFAPASWRLLEHRVADLDLSDHLPVMSEFRLPVDPVETPAD
ncbi:MAG: hypothetical protein DWQ42_05465 [Planctomycetota bacterium]|nr:MAG: hypothetical protein DWQ42_05465 [Planctomycetota bacterium]REK42427.1 MAG: hypothetical protein DWQ46_13105 [Planctomycetota bacterium]